MAEDRVPFSQNESKPEPEVKGHEGVWEGTLSFMDDMNYHRMSDFFEVSYEDRKVHHLAEKLSVLTDWAKEQTKSDDRLQQQQAIKNLINGLGYQIKGKELVTKLHQWVRLDIDRRRIEQQMELLK